MNLTSPAMRRLSVAVVVALVAGVVFLASRAEGNVVPEPDLHDAGIWVSNESSRVIGRTNAEIATVDTKLDAGAASFELMQSGRVVLLHQQDPPGLVGVDPAHSLLIPGPDLPPDAQVSLGSQTAALFVPDTGELFVVPATSSSAALALDPAKEDAVPVHVIDGPGRMVVGTDGSVHLLEVATGSITTWSMEGELVDETSVPPAIDDPTLTAVGPEPVVLSAAGDVVFGGGEPIGVDVGETVVVQEPGPAASSVLVAGDDGLVEVSSGGAVTDLFTAGTGSPARPVRLGGCVYGAWGGDPVYVQLCGDDEPVSDGIAEMDSGSSLRFRTNHGRITLNNLTVGSQLLFGDDEPVFIDNQWAEALTDEIVEDPEAEEKIDEEAQATCESTDNGDPVAEPDDGIFGTRSGRPVVVYPLRNDADPDCDVLLITDVSLADRDAGTLGIIDGGRAVQVTMAEGVQRLRFDYTVSDGRGGTASSYATVTVVPESRNSEPVLGDEETFVVSGGTVTHNVLATAYDPDGDVLRLLDARLSQPADSATHSVRSNPSGDVTFTAGSGTGLVEVTYVVGDGRGGEQTGVLSVHVGDRRENQPPQARNDSVTSFVGREVVVDVLDNDTDPNGDTVSIVRAAAREDATVRWTPTSPEIRVTSDTPGTVNVVYRITDGQANDEAVLRVDFEERGEKRPPVAVRDEVLLSAGEPAYVPVLDNDVDPDGEVLVVLGVSDLPERSPITVTVLRRSVLKIVAPTPLQEPVAFTYRISDGTDVADGTVVVEPAPVTTENRPPVAVADEYTVRAGGVVTLPVLTNDSDPDGDAIEIEPPPARQDTAARDGLLFLSEDGTLRYEAPSTPRGTVELVYSVRDTADNVASAEVTLHVLPPNADRNQPPVAPELVGRTVAGQRVTIPVPVTTMDPDGDSVTLLGLDDVPELGTVIEVRADEIVYEADDDAAGTDEFSYRVVDQFGAEAVGTILVGVAARPNQNNPPIPTDDEAVVRPGATVSIPVLANDFDPDADPLTISDAPEDRPTPTIGRVEVDRDRIRYTAPEDPEAPQTTFRYVADDGRGGTAPATVTLTFRGDDDNRAPIAVDDTTEPQPAGTEISLPVLLNDEDPDQDPLEISDVSLEDATISADGQSIEFVMPDTPVQFTYAASDGTDEARAAVQVPLLDPDADRPPVVGFDGGIEVDIGSSVTIDVLANDEDPEGEQLYLFDVIGLRHGTAVIEDDEVVFTASEERYVGDAGFSYIVGDKPDPAVANTSVGSVKLRITGHVNTFPEFTELQVDVPAGGERRIELAKAVVDPDEQDEHSFSDLRTDSDVFDVSIDDGVFTVSAPPDAAPGSTAMVTLTVSDGTDEADGSIRVNVVGSDRPLVQTGSDSGETIQGQPVTVDVLANDTNPFPETPLTITSVGSPSGGAGSASANGSSITFTPTESFFGETTFTYRVQDATGAADREVQGTVTITVIGRPSAPPAPTCIGGESRQVRVQWVAPSANGAPITHYVVRVAGTGAGTGDRQVSNASTQDIGGLTNGAEYTFQVGAVNSAVTGAGAEPNFSAPSPTCTPDEVPGQPAPPNTTFGDQELTVEWTLPENAGSAIVKQTLTNTTTGESRDLGPAETSLVWDGLENGTSYRFTVVAENQLGRGPVSELSTGDGIPAGVPAAPDVPTTTAGDMFIDVAWTWRAADNNGDAPDAFRVTALRNGVEDQVVEVGATARTQRFSTDNDVDYQFTVAARNKAGWSEPSGMSAVTVSAGPPLGTPVVTASEGDTQSVLTIDASAVKDNGADIQGWEYRANGGAWRTLATNRIVNNLTNGTDYRFEVRAINAVGPGVASAPSDTVNPYGNPTTPNVSRTVNGRTITWTWTASSGNGRSIDRYQYSLDGGSWTNIGSREFSRQFGYSESHTLRVRAVSTAADANRRISGVGSASGRTIDDPAVIEATAGGTTPCDIGGGTCRKYAASGRNLQPNTTYTLYCQFTDAGSWGDEQFGVSVTTNGQGAFNYGNKCHVGAYTQLRYVVRGPGGPYYSRAVSG